MTRVYRLSKIGAKLPRRHSYGPATNADDCERGFEVYKGPVYSIANTIGPGLGSLGEGDFTSSAGYDHILLIDVRAFQGHPWNPFAWLVVQPEDTECLRTVRVADLHAWLNRQAACVGPEGQLSRDAVVAWVSGHKDVVESWLEQNSQEAQIEFTDTIGST